MLRLLPKPLSNLPLLFAGAAFFVALGILLFALPASMDDFGAYHPIACYYFPDAYLHTMREPCSASYDLFWHGKKIWTRAGGYVGAFESIAYFPFYFLYPHPFSTYLYGFACFCLMAFAFSRLAGMPFALSLFGFAAQFFVFYQIVRNGGGNSSLQAAALFFVPLLVREVADAEGRRWLGLSAVLAMLVFAAFEAKPFFIYAFPALIVLSLYHLLSLKNRPWNESFLRLLPAVLFCAGLTVFWLSLEGPDGRSNFSTLMRFGATFPLYQHDDFLDHVWALSERYLLNFAAASDFSHGGPGGLIRMQGTPLLLGRAFTALWWMLLVIPTIYELFIRQAPLRSLSLGTLCFIGGVATLLLSCSNALTVNPHHTNLAQIFFAGSFVYYFGQVWQRRRQCRSAALCILAVLIAGNALLAFNRPPSLPHSADRYEILALLRRQPGPERSIVVYVDWGMYFMGALYASPRQLILYAEPPRPAWRARLQHLVRTAQRDRVYMVGYANSLNLNSLKKDFPLAYRLYPASGEKRGWEVWADSPPMR